MTVFISWAGGEAKIIARQLKKAISKCLPINEYDIYFSPDDIECGARFSSAEKIQDYDFAIFLLNEENKLIHCINKEYINFCKQKKEKAVYMHSYIISTTGEHCGDLGATEFCGRNSVRYDRDGLAKLFTHMSNLLGCKCRIDSGFQTVWSRYLIQTKINEIEKRENEKRSKKQIEHGTNKAKAEKADKHMIGTSKSYNI
jgi:hypothetical protein